MAENGSITLSESVLEAVWEGETEASWKLLRLHQFANFCAAGFTRETDGAIRFMPIEDLRHGGHP